jgi:hypothetical protein
MLAADLARNAGANQDAITDAFKRHGISLAPPDRALADRSTLVAPTGRKRGARGAAAAVTPTRVASEVRKRLKADPGGRMAHEAMLFGSERADKFVYRREGPLTGLSERLAGVVALAPEPVVVGVRRGYATLRSSVPESTATTDEVHYFVQSLLERGAIAFDGDGRGVKRAARARATHARRGVGAGPAAIPAVAPAPPTDVVTHVVETRGGQKVLMRVRFACGCAR